MFCHEKTDLPIVRFLGLTFGGRYNLTDPEWTPLFKLASAVVADTGSALSHAAIVAREYNIPAVLGVGFATTKFKDGDTIQVDGNTGEVKGC